MTGEEQAEDHPTALDSMSDSEPKAAGQEARVNGVSTDYRPARGYSWPPFEPGNLKALRHGGNSPRLIAEKAREVHAALLDVAPYLAEPKFLPAVERYLNAAAREALLHDHVSRLSAEQGAGAVPARVWEQVTSAARLAARLGTDLGLDPIGHARIRALSVTAEASEATLADLAEQGRGTAGFVTYAEKRKPPPTVSGADPPVNDTDSGGTS